MAVAVKGYPISRASFEASQVCLWCSALSFDGFGVTCLLLFSGQADQCVYIYKQQHNKQNSPAVIYLNIDCKIRNTVNFNRSFNIVMERHGM